MRQLLKAKADLMGCFVEVPSPFDYFKNSLKTIDQCYRRRVFAYLLRFKGNKLIIYFPACFIFEDLYKQF